MLLVEKDLVNLAYLLMFPQIIMFVC